MRNHIILFMLTAISALAGTDEYRFVNTTDTLYVATLRMHGQNFDFHAVPPNSESTITNRENDAISVHLVHPDTLSFVYTENVTSTGLSDVGQVSLYYVTQGPDVLSPNVVKALTRNSIRDQESARLLEIFIMGMVMAATVRLVRTGLRWSRAHLTDTDIA